MTDPRIQSNYRASQLWATLRLRSDKGLSAKEAEIAGIASEPYARKTMRAWTQAGFLIYAAPENRRLDAGRYAMTAAAPLAVPTTSKGVAISLDPAMRADEFAAIRRKSGLSAEAFGRALGRTGHRVTVTNEMRKYETGKKHILQATADKVRELAKTL